MSQKVEIPIPQDVIFQFLKELPAESLLRFRCVSKLWCSIIDDPFFVHAHRTRSHTRPGGTTILVQSQSRDDGTEGYDFFSLKPEGGSPSVFLQTLPSKNISLSSHSVDGLVCLGNVVWNPTTRETMKLPPLHIRRDIDSDYHRTKVDFWSNYSLGFAPSTMEYKVLNVCQKRKKRKKNNQRNSREYRVMCKILTIGDNRWRDADPLPGEFCIRGSLCIGGTIYWFGTHADKMLSFDVGLEKFRWISLPNGGFRWPTHSIQVGEHLALIDDKVEKIWMLDDKGRWNMDTLVVPKKYSNQSRPNYYRLTPIGTIHHGEILVRCDSRDPAKLFYCNPYNKTSRRMHFPGLSETYIVPNTSFAKQVECLFKLKQRN